MSTVITERGSELFSQMFPERYKISGYMTLLVENVCACCGDSLSSAPVPAACIKAKPVTYDVYHQQGNGLVMEPVKYGQRFKIPRRLHGKWVHIGYLASDRSVMYYDEKPILAFAGRTINVTDPDERCDHEYPCS